MTLNPEDIARRTFAIEERGYDRDEVRTFLSEVAVSFRAAQHGPPGGPEPLPDATAAIEIPAPTGEFLMELAFSTDPQSDHDPEVAPSTIVTGDLGSHALDIGQADVEHFAQLGADVAEVLRATHDVVTLMQEQAESDARVIGEQAELDAHAIRAQAESDAGEVGRRAETEAAWHVERAKRVLMTAQEQSEIIVSEAEAQARAVLTSARDQAEEHAAQVAARARRHAEQILRAERESLRRLHEAQAHVAEAIEMLADAETRPVVDLTDARPNVRFGVVSVPMDDDNQNDDDASTTGLMSKDPVARMVRAAVGRAVTGAVDHAGDDAPAADPHLGTDPDLGTGPDPAADAHPDATIGSESPPDV